MREAATMPELLFNTRFVSVSRAAASARRNLCDATVLAPEIPCKDNVVSVANAVSNSETAPISSPWRLLRWPIRWSSTEVVASRDTAARRMSAATVFKLSVKLMKVGFRSVTFDTSAWS
jgi:hypothetical protein